jgi:hypothetical protein
VRATRAGPGEGEGEGGLAGASAAGGGLAGGGGDAAGVRDTLTLPEGCGTGSGPAAGPSTMRAARETSRPPRARWRASFCSGDDAGMVAAWDIGTSCWAAVSWSPNSHSEAKSLKPGTRGGRGPAGSASRATCSTGAGRAGSGAAAS